MSDQTTISESSFDHPVYKSNNCKTICIDIKKNYCASEDFSSGVCCENEESNCRIG